MPERLLETKFHVPAWRADGVVRPRLLNHLRAGLAQRRKLMLVSAPAGYGKTTLVAGWVGSLDEPTRHIWLSLENSDNDLAHFLYYWTTGWSRIGDFGAESILELLEASPLPPYQSILDEVINALSPLEEPAILVLDDYHIITNPAIHETVEYFLEHQPGQAYVVIITRSDPPIPLARFRAHGQMVETRASDLRFTEEEARRFFSDSMHVVLDDEDVHSLETRTEGWVVGLQLAALALKNLSDPRGFVETFRGSHRYVLDYLGEEIIRQQADDVRRFLVQTSVMERFNESSCEALTGNPNSRALLLELERANLFLVPLDDDRIWYRYHHLFAEFLRTELSGPEMEDLHRKAALWHEQHGFLPEAVQYATASRDLELLADVIDRGLRQDAIWSGGNLTLFASWLEALPPQAFQGRPTLSLNASHLLYLLGRFDLAEGRIDQAEQALQSVPSTTANDQLLVLASLYRGVVAAVRGDSAQAIERIRFAQERLPRENHLQQARGSFSLGLAYQLSGQTALAEETFLRSSEEAQSAGVLSLAIHALGAAAQVQISQGELSRAEQACRTAMRLAGGRQSPSLGLVESILGGIALERNDLATAEGFLQTGIALSRRGGRLDDLLVGLSHLARLHAYQGRVSEAFDAIQEARTIIQGFGVERMSVLAAAHVASLQLFTGQEAAARKWAVAYQATRASQAREFAELTLVRVLLRGGDRKDVPAILNALLEREQSQGRVRTHMEVMILMASFHIAEQQEPAAIDWLSQALKLAAPERFVRIFLDEGDALLGLLPKARKAAPELVDVILDSQRPDRGTHRSPLGGLADPLSGQELRVLSLIVLGKSNQEIADELVISLGTAKWHVHNILQKLGVGNRSQAIARARDLGF